MKPRAFLCIPLQAKNLFSLSQKIIKARKKADIIEIWLDQLSIFNFSEIKKNTKKPLIFVNKAVQEKGSWQGSEKERIGLLIKSLEIKPAYIDIGIHTSPALIKKLLSAKMKIAPTTKIIISHHNFNHTPSQTELWKIVNKAKELGADIVKIATTAQTLDDNLVIFNLLAKARQDRIPLIALCMGRQGRISRMLGSVFGSYLTYAAIDRSSLTAPGQLVVEEMENIQRGVLGI